MSFISGNQQWGTGKKAILYSIWYKYTIYDHLQIVHSFLHQYEEGDRTVKLNEVKTPFGSIVVISQIP